MNKKFRFKLNIFDSIVLVVGLVAVAVLGYFMMKPAAAPETSANVQTIRYTVRIEGAILGTGAQIKPGHVLVDSIKNYAIGTVEKDGQKTEDYIIDDTALAYMGEKGLSIITGCSHAGICNIIEYAKKLTGVEKVQSVLGGFHLFHVDDRAKATISYLKEENIPELYPCHCTSFAVRAALHQESPVQEVAVGTELCWD